MRVLLLLAMGLIGCGGSSTRDPAASGGSSGGGSSGGVSLGGSGGMGAVSGGGGSGGIATGGTGGAIECSAFLDEPLPLNPVTIRIKNAKDVPIYIGSEINCGVYELYKISGPNGPVALHAGGCGFTCEGLQQHGDECPDACLVPPLIYIAPGGSYDQLWAGTTYELAYMPTECYFQPQYAYDSCQRRVAAAAGEYTAIAEAGTEVACIDVGLCSCTPGSTGSCEIAYGGTPSGVLIQGNASFTMPASDLVELTFQ